MDDHNQSGIERFARDLRRERRDDLPDQALADDLARASGDAARMAALAERLLASPATLRHSAARLRVPPPLLAAWLTRASDTAARNLGDLLSSARASAAARLTLPVAAAAFASEAMELYSHRMELDDGTSVCLVEEAGGLLGVFVRSQDSELGGQTVTILLTPETLTEPVHFDLELVGLEAGGSGAHGVLGSLDDLLSRLGRRPECTVVRR